jgi:hypothetical protein
MSAQSVFQVSPEQIRHLQDYQLRDLMQALLWAEAVRCNANRSQICVNQELKAGDEGCDGESPAHSEPADWMPAQKTCWQLKAGSAGEPAKLKGEILKKIPRATLADGGAYVVVASQAAGTKQVNDRLAVLREEAASQGLPTDKIRVYDCERLANWINQFPAVAARLAGLPEGLFLLDDWEHQEQFTGKYHASAEVAKWIEDMQRGLDFGSGGIRHVHIVGQPGVGKTRLALEVGLAPHLGRVLVYFDSFRPGIVDVLARVRATPGTWLLAVVDEASPDAIRQLHEQARVADGRLRLITVGSARPGDSADISILGMKPLSRNEMTLVVSDYAPQLPHEHADFAVRFADGYVKLARLVCDSLSREPDLKALEMLQQTGDMARLLDRLLGDLPNLDRRCLHVLALLRQVGWSEDRENEGRAVAEWLGLNWVDVKQTVHGVHRKAGIAPLAGRLRYISPRPLALYLALEALDVYGSQLRDLPAKLPNDSAREAFYSRLSDLADFPAARRQCREELERFFSLADLRHDYNARVWSHLALTDPLYAARQIRQILERASREEIHAFGDGRREVVWTLVKLAWPRASFRDAMLALAELAVAENENIANNSTSEFIQRYQVVLGGTAVPYLERLSVLDELLKRADLAYHRLVARALGMAGHFDESRTRGGEDHGNRTVEEEWHPSTSKEEAEARQEALRRLAMLVQQGDPALENDLVDVVSHSVGPFVHAHYVRGLQELLLPLVQRFPFHRETLRAQVADQMEAWVPATGESSHPEYAALCQLHSALVDPSLEGRLMEHIGRPDWKDGDHSAELAQLVGEFLATPELLRQHFGWLTSGKAGSGWAFGQMLGEQDVEACLQPIVLGREGRGQDLLIVSAYLVGQSRHHPPGWLDDWLDSQFARGDPDDALILDATWRTGPSDRGARRFLDLLRSGRLPHDAFWCLRYGRWPLDVSMDCLQDLIVALTRQARLRPLALQMLATRLHHRPQDLGQLTVVAAELVADTQLARHERGRAWAEIATRLVPTMARSIARTLFGAHRLGDSWFLRHSHGAAVMAQCVAHDPQGTWDELRPILEDPDDVRLFIIGFPRGVVEQLPRNALVEWAACEVPHRPCLLARLTTPDFSRDASLAAQLANIYADDTDVSSALFAESMSGVYRGSSADHWTRKADSLQEAASKTQLPGLRRWAMQAAGWFREMAERDRIREEENKVLR